MRKLLGLCAALLPFWPSSGSAQSAPSMDLSSLPQAAANIWTRVAFGPTQIIWFVVAAIAGGIVYLVYYRGFLKAELRRLPDPLEPGRHRMSALGAGIVAAALVLGWSSFQLGFLYVILLVALGSVIDLFGGRRVVWLGLAIIAGILVWGFYFAR